MEGMPEALGDEISIEIVAHAHDAWVNKVVWTRRV